MARTVPMREPAACAKGSQTSNVWAEEGCEERVALARQTRAALTACLYSSATVFFQRRRHAREVGNAARCVRSQVARWGRLDSRELAFRASKQKAEDDLSHLCKSQLCACLQQAVRGPPSPWPAPRWHTNVRSIRHTNVWSIRTCCPIRFLMAHNTHTHTHTHTYIHTYTCIHTCVYTHINHPHVPRNLLPQGTLSPLNVIATRFMIGVRKHGRRRTLSSKHSTLTSLSLSSTEGSGVDSRAWRCISML